MLELQQPLAYTPETPPAPSIPAGYYDPEHFNFAEVEGELYPIPKQLTWENETYMLDPTNGSLIGEGVIFFGEESYVGYRAIIKKNSRFENFCWIGNYSIIGSDVRFGQGTVAREAVRVADKVTTAPMVHLEKGSHIDTSSRIGFGSRVGEQSYVGHRAVLGEYVEVKKGAHVGAYDKLADRVTVGPKSYLYPHVTLEEDVSLGVGNVIERDGRVGKNTRIKHYFRAESNVAIGPDNTIGNNVHIKEDSRTEAHCELEDNATLGIMVKLKNNVTVEQGTHVYTRRRIFGRRVKSNRLVRAGMRKIKTFKKHGQHERP